MRNAEARARRFLRCYPSAWRERYGEEFACLLADDLSDRPHDLSRDLDVIRSGIRARLSCCGIADGPIKNSTGLTTTILAALLIIVLGATSIWTQLADGSLHHTPDTYTARLAFTMLTATGAFVAAAAVSAGFVVLCGVITAVRAGRGRQLRLPTGLLLVAIGVLAAGPIAVRGIWPGHLQARTGEGLVAHIAQLTWAWTDSISTYWIHPTRLLARPHTELAWMVASPIAFLLLILAARRILAAIEPTDLAPRWARVGRAAHTTIVTACLLACTTWVLASQHDSNITLRAGTLDLALIAAMTVAAAVIRAATRRLATPTT